MGLCENQECTFKALSTRAQVSRLLGEPVPHYLALLPLGCPRSCHGYRSTEMIQGAASHMALTRAVSRDQQDPQTWVSFLLSKAPAELSSLAHKLVSEHMAKESPQQEKHEPLRVQEVRTGACLMGLEQSKQGARYTVNTEAKQTQDEKLLLASPKLTPHTRAAGRMRDSF